MSSRKLAAAVLVVLAGLGASARTQAGEPTAVPVEGLSVRAASTGTPSVNDAMRALDKLRSLGYAWTTDAGALKAVKAWQRSNGLEVDGIVGPQTLASLNLPATAAAAAVRVPTVAVGEPPVPALDGCAEAQQYRIAAGLPDVFDSLIRRESRCANTPISRTGCCVGYLQLHSIIFRDHRMIDPLADCGATWQNVRGDDAGSKQRQMCAAAALYSVMGLSPWAL